ncbi:MAG: Nif3-like dinuclear metal center hexameric protein [Clostridia bacterium]|nr:Nif3-like dinuclear metal center hexameric protein [Clostridia bacterium]
MRLHEIYKILDGLAPKALSDEYCASCHADDNSGVLVDCGEEIKGVLFTLDLSHAAIDRAMEKGMNVIVTHHPAIYGKIGNICVDDSGLLGGKLVKCLRNGISVISMHLNLDCAVGGIDESLMQGICHAAGGEDKADVQIMHPLSVGGYGRSYGVQEITLAELAENMKKEFSSSRVLYYGDGKKMIRRAASFCGAGGDESGVAFAKKTGADVMISSDFKHHVITMAQESGLAMIVLTHYASENYGFEKYYEKIRRQTGIPCEYHTDENLL